MVALRVGVGAVLLASVIALAGGLHVQAQGLNSGLFNRYIDALRQEHRIPGMSVVVLHNGAEVFGGGFGQADVAQAIAARSDTPYPIANLTETIGAAAVLQQCVDYGTAELSDRVIRWAPFPDESATLLQLLGHTTSGGYAYSPSRFAALADVTAECAKRPYSQVVGTLLERLAMTRSVPGLDAADDSGSETFSPDDTARYRSALLQMAVPYRVGSAGPSRTEYGVRTLTAATGLVSTAQDLAKFASAIDAGIVLSEELVQQSLTRGEERPTGLGWFVQEYNGTKLVWHFGVARDAYSSLMVKVPDRDLTLIMLANSDRLATSLSTAQPDVTQSVFVRTFLRLFVD